MAELRPEMVSMVVRTKEPPPEPTWLTREQAIDAARADLRMEKLLRNAPSPRIRAESSEQWGVWLIHFSDGDRRLGFASVNRQGEVVEVGGVDEHDDKDGEPR